MLISEFGSRITPDRPANYAATAAATRLHYPSWWLAAQIGANYKSEDYLFRRIQRKRPCFWTFAGFARVPSQRNLLRYWHEYYCRFDNENVQKRAANPPRIQYRRGIKSI